MSSQLKISADTSQVKKSILDVGKTLKELKGSKVQIFSAEDKKFMKSEFKKEAALMKAKLRENREEIKKMTEAQRALVSGTEEELENRKKILEAYKVQAKLARDLGKIQKASKHGGDIDKSGKGGMMGSILGFAKMIPGLAAVATIGYAVQKGMASNDQYVAGAGSRNKLKGLGVDDETFGSPKDLARVGLTEQDMIQRRADATAVLGRQGTSNETEMKKAGFERAFGLEGGTMTGIASQMRGQMGGKGATDAQMKLQASVLASGMEDAIGPYLDSAVQLLTQINDNGTTNTSEMTAMLAQLTKDGQRTPEQLARAFGGINDSVKGASGEGSAFLQTAFAKGGIGGGTIGGTKFSMASGGIMGQNRQELEKRGYNKDLLDNMEKNGMMSGVGKRTGAIMDQMRASGGMKPGENISDIKDTDRMIGMGNLASKTLGIKDPSQAFDALMMMEQVEKKQMSQKQFDEKIKQMQEGNDPSVSRLDKINNTLSGQTEYLRNINTNLMEALGKEAVQAGNEIVRADNEGIVGVNNVAGAINDSGATKKAGNAATGLGKILNGTGFDASFGYHERRDKKKFDEMTSDDAVIEAAQKKRREGTGFKGMTEEQVEAKVRASLAKQVSAKEIGKEVASALKANPITNIIENKVVPPMSTPTNRTTK